MAETKPSLALKVVIRCADFEASRRFYADVLGLPVQTEWDEPEGKGCIFGLGPSGKDAQLEIYEMTRRDPRFDEAFARPVANDKVDLQLRTDSLPAWCARLRDRWPFAGPDELAWGARWIKLRDPDRLLVAIYEEIPAQR